MENHCGQICDNLAGNGPGMPQTDPVDPREAWRHQHRVDRLMSRHEGIPYMLWGCAPVSREEVEEDLANGVYDETPPQDRPTEPEIPEARDTIPCPFGYPEDFYPGMDDEDAYEFVPDSEYELVDVELVDEEEL